MSDTAVGSGNAQGNGSATRPGGGARPEVVVCPWCHQPVEQLSNLDANASGGPVYARTHVCEGCNVHIAVTPWVRSWTKQIKENGR